MPGTDLLPANQQPFDLPPFIPGENAMLFHSPEYLLGFLPVAVMMYFLLGRHGGLMARLWLAAVSLAFYAWWSTAYLWLLATSVVLNFAASRQLATLKGSNRRWLLAIALAANAGLLGYFKYADFFIENTNRLLSENFPLLHLAFPLAISFFTIQQIAYLVDVYEGSAHERSFLDYCLFVTFFPHLMAGPILHHREIMPQFSAKAAPAVDWANVFQGLVIMAIGLLKKILLADNLDVTSDDGFARAATLHFHEAWLTSLSYSLQIYFDFSGYTDLAIGAALLFNIRLPENFNSPFRATSLQDYWKRWHITLTRFITAYIYTPLVRYTPGSITFTKAMFATWLAMLVAGLWHGPGWNFVLFGAMHGLGLVISHIWQRNGTDLPRWLAWLLTFLFVNAALVIFRAENLTVAAHMLAGMVGAHGHASTDELLELIKGLSTIDAWNPLNVSTYLPARPAVLLAAMLLVLRAPNTRQLCQLSWLLPDGRGTGVPGGLLVGLALFYAFFMTSGLQTFIYFYF